MQGAVSKDVQGKESITLTMPVQYVKGVGPARAAIFEKLGVQTVGDLLEYFPRDWVFAPGPIKIGADAARTSRPPSSAWSSPSTFNSTAVCRCWR